LFLALRRKQKGKKIQDVKKSASSAHQMLCRKFSSVWADGVHLPEQFELSGILNKHNLNFIVTLLTTSVFLPLNGISGRFHRYLVTFMVDTNHIFPLPDS
jgi:hypothetical protein